jgi:hypothetical protein
VTLVCSFFSPITAESKNVLRSGNQLLIILFLLFFLQNHFPCTDIQRLLIQILFIYSWFMSNHHFHTDYGHSFAALERFCLPGSIQSLLCLLWLVNTAENKTKTNEYIFTLNIS